MDKFFRGQGKKGGGEMKRIGIVVMIMVMCIFFSNVAWAYMYDAITYNTNGTKVMAQTYDSLTNQLKSTTNFFNGLINTIKDAITNAMVQYNYAGGLLRSTVSWGGGNPLEVDLYDIAGQNVLTLQDADGNENNGLTAGNYGIFEEYAGTGGTSNQADINAFNAATAQGQNIAALNNKAAENVDNFLSNLNSVYGIAGATAVKGGTHSGAQFVMTNYKVTATSIDTNGDGYRETSVGFKNTAYGFGGTRDAMAVDSFTIKNTSGRETGTPVTGGLLGYQADVNNNPTNTPLVTDPSYGHKAHGDGKFDPETLASGTLSQGANGSLYLTLANGQKISVTIADDNLRAYANGLIGQSVTFFGDSNGTDANGNGSIDGNEMNSVSNLDLWEVR